MSESANKRAHFTPDQGNFCCQGTCLTLIRLRSNKNHTFIFFCYYLSSNLSSSFLFKYQWRSPLVQKLPLLKGSQSRNAESDRERYESIKCELKHRSISIIADLNQILWSTCSSNQTLSLWSTTSSCTGERYPSPKLLPQEGDED